MDYHILKLVSDSQLTKPFKYMLILGLLIVFFCEDLCSLACNFLRLHRKSVTLY